MFDYENQAKRDGHEWIIGIDEAGRGPLAGPVVASAVALKNINFHTQIKDSKKLTANQRTKAFHEIYANAFVGVGIMSESVIDGINILQATFMAMRNAVEHLISQIPESKRKQKKFDRSVCLLVDGNAFKSGLPYAYKTVVGGDNLIFSIACASIVAKVTRDRILATYDQIFPEYGFKQHKGYPTVKHKQAIKQFGPSIIHRRSFQSV